MTCRIQLCVFMKESNMDSCPEMRGNTILIKTLKFVNAIPIINKL